MTSSSTRGSSARWATVTAVALFVAASGVQAKVLRYALQVEDHLPARLVMNVPVEHPGTMVVEAEWSGTRILSFRLVKPNEEETVVRRSGPSPQRLEFEVPPEQAGPDVTWRLQVRSLPQAGTVDGSITIRTPEEAGEPGTAAPSPAPEPPAGRFVAEPLEETAPWRKARRAPQTADAGARRVFDAVERLRSQLVDPDGAARPDPCGWQDDLLRFLSERLDRLASGGRQAGSPKAATARYFRRVAATVRDVERVRTSNDPILAGPPPDDPGNVREWEMLHRDALRPLERKLDELVGQVREGFVPELEQRDWPRRFAGCVTACERRFTRGERGGPGEPADVEWQPILAAAAALDALADLAGAPPAP